MLTEVSLPMNRELFHCFQDVRLTDEGRYYCMAKNKFGNETVNGHMLVRSKNFIAIVIKACGMPVFNLVILHHEREKERGE